HEQHGGRHLRLLAAYALKALTARFAGVARRWRLAWACILLGSSAGWPPWWPSPSCTSRSWGPWRFPSSALASWRQPLACRSAAWPRGGRLPRRDGGWTRLGDLLADRRPE